MSGPHSSLLILLLASCDAPSSSTDTALPPSLYVQTWPTVEAQIAADAHAFLGDGSGRFSARLPLLRAEVGPDGALLTQRGHELPIALSGYGRDDRWTTAEPVEPSLGAGRVEVLRDGVTEWWVARTQGLQQGWTFAQRPAGRGDLRLEVRFDGAFVEADGDDLSIVSADGQRWQYRDLAAWDATGAPLLAWVEADADRAWLNVDDDGAEYPLTVDPFTSASEYQFESSDNTTGDWFGTALSGAGDIDGDGYADLIAGAYLDDDDGTSSGSAYIYYGAASGLSTREDKITASDAAASDYFGYHVAGAGDVDGDGYDDVIVGASYDDDDGTSSGAAYIYYGSSSGISTREDKITASDAAASDFFGGVVSGGVDIDGDGYSDVLVSAVGDDDNGADSGSAYVYYGSSSGISTREDKITASDGAAWDTFGRGASAGDIDGDGYGDIVIGAMEDDDNGADSGSAYVYYGSSSGISTREDKITASDGQRQDYFGWPLAGAGDLDGDGYDDVAVGTPNDNIITGSVYVYYGSSSGISTREDNIVPADIQDLDEFGAALSGAGDIDGDGYDDLVIGKPIPNSVSYLGAAYLFFGSSSGISATGSKLTASDGFTGDFFGGAVAGVGDLNNDGYSEVAIQGARTDASGSRLNVVYTYFYSSSGTDADGDHIGSDIDCDDSDDEVGAEGSGWYADADGDGYGDPDSRTVACSQPSGYIEDNTDCDDTDAAINPSAAEVCNSTDDDCDGATDERLTTTYYSDDDGDSFGDPASAIAACSQPSGYVEDNTDCDDTDTAINPSAAEVCNSTDDDCDGATDEGLTTTYFSDDDGDSFGDPDGPTEACAQPSGTVTDDSDCDDTDAEINPSAAELCDGADNDCDGNTDEDDAADVLTWYADADTDGYGNADTTDQACTQPAGFAASSDDCDDDDDAVHPGAEEICGDGIDNDCDTIGGPSSDDDDDGLSWAEEQKLGSDDCDIDTDDDGLTDSAEIEAGTDILDDDSDDDGLSDGDEVNTTGTDPLDDDSDDDGLGDGAEVEAGTDPLDDDSDDDGLSDGEDSDPLVAVEDEDTGSAEEEIEAEEVGKGCSSAPGAPAGWLALLAGLFVYRRRD